MTSETYPCYVIDDAGDFATNGGEGPGYTVFDEAETPLVFSDAINVCLLDEHVGAFEAEMIENNVEFRPDGRVVIGVGSQGAVMEAAEVYDEIDKEKNQ
jgi:hypothetical protein